MGLERFSAPANLVETAQENLDAWSDRLSKLFAFFAQSFANFYNPIAETSLDDQRIAPVTWPVFPGTLLSERISPEERWRAADSDRNIQDEYCEWSVLRDADGNILRVTFTTEVPDYYDHLMDVDREVLLDLYERALGQRPSIDDLFDQNGLFEAQNQLNSSTDGPIVHLCQTNNTLRAALQLAADATILRERAGQAVVHPQTLVQCGRLGEPRRHSDPQIAAAVNNLVRGGSDVTLADPPGLYIDNLVITGMETRDGVDAQEFWTIERGSASHTVRASFEVPQERGYTVSDITINGQPIRFGAQIAERVHVRLDAIAKQSAAPPPTPEPCVG